MKKSKFYSQKADDVAKHEGLEYIRTEKMVRFLLAAGRIPQDNYVYWAECLVSSVLSEPDEKMWPKLYQQYRQKMHREERGAGVIERWGISHWTDMFRAFYFASVRWEKAERSQNYVRLVRFYVRMKTLEREGRSDDKFSMEFIHETFALWEGLRDGAALAAFAELVCSKQITGNWNSYPIFFKYIRESLLALYYAGYIDRYDIWQLEGLSDDVDKKDYRALALEIVRGVTRELRDKLAVLARYEEYLPQEKPRYESFIQLMDFYQSVLNAERDGIYREDSGVRTTVHSPSGEAYHAVEQIVDDAVFKEKVNSRPEALSVAACIQLIKNRFQKE